MIMKGHHKTGNSTAASTYPIPEAPERSDQLGNMTLICQSRMGEIENNSENEYKEWLDQKTENFGHLRRCNVTKTGLKELFILQLKQQRQLSIE